MTAQEKVSTENRARETAASEPRKYQLDVLFGTTGSTVFSVAIIFVNKYLVQTHDFTFMATLTGWHVCMTWLIIHTAKTMGLITHKVRFLF